MCECVTSMDYKLALLSLLELETLPTTLSIHLYFNTPHLFFFLHQHQHQHHLLLCLIISISKIYPFNLLGTAKQNLCIYISISLFLLYVYAECSSNCRLQKLQGPGEVPALYHIKSGGVQTKEVLKRRLKKNY